MTANSYDAPKGSTTVLVVAVAILALIADILVSNVVAAGYLRQTSAQAAALNSSFQEVLRCRQNLGSTVHDVDVYNLSRQIVNVNICVDKTRSALASFRQKQDLADLGPAFTSKYKQAQVLEMRSGNIAAQSQQVLDAYGTVLDYLNAVNGVAVQVKTLNTRGSKLGDYKSIESQRAQAAAGLKQLQEQQAKLSNLTVPAGFSQFNAALSDSLSQVTTAYGKMAAAGALPLAMQQLDAVSAKMESTDTDLMLQAYDKAPAVGDVDGLADKIADLLPEQPRNKS
jgi:hypothetical protein